MAQVQTPKKKSALSFLKGAFIQEDPLEEQTSEPAFIPPSTAATPVVTTTKTSKATKILQEALESNALDSYDYLKFKNATQELAKDILDEKLRFKTVFSAAKVMGVTPAKLVQTADHYLTVLNQELKNFNEAVEEQIKTKIVGSLNEVTLLEDSIVAKTADIKELTANVNTLTAQKNILAAKVETDKALIDDNKITFLAVQATMVQDIKNDITKLTNYLG